MRRLLLPPQILLLGLATSGTSLALQASFNPIGSLGPVGSAAFAVDRDGSTVVGVSIGAAGQTAFRWTAATGMIDLGDLPGGGTSSRAFAVSGDGQIVVGSSSSGQHTEEPFRWTAGAGMVGLGVHPGGVQGQANDVTDDGGTVVGSGLPQSGLGSTLHWTPATGMTALMSNSWSDGISADGSVIVGGMFQATSVEAYRWTAATGAVGLGNFPGGSNFSAGRAVSADGQVVVGEGLTAAGIQAFRWTAATGMVSLANATYPMSEAYGVDAVGSIVVGTGSDVTGTQRALLWTQSTGLVDLRDHLMSLGATGLNGWDLIFAEDVSDDGNAIVGTGLDASGVPQGFVAYLSPPTLPIGSPFCQPAVANSTGSPAAISAAGSADVQHNNVTLRAEQLPQGSFGYFLVSQTQDFVVGPGGSLGNLCLGGSIGRYSALGQIQSSGAAGVFSLTLDLANTPTPLGPAAIAPMETWNFQCWYRDANPGVVTNFSDAVSILFR